MINKQTRSNVIPFPMKSSSSQAEIDYALLYDRAAKLAILTGYLGARDGYTKNQVIEMMITELDSKGGVNHEKSKTLELVKTGFALFQNKPGMTSEAVYKMANRHS